MMTKKVNVAKRLKKVKKVNKIQKKRKKRLRLMMESNMIYKM